MYMSLTVHVRNPKQTKSYKAMLRHYNFLRLLDDYSLGVFLKVPLRAGYKFNHFIVLLYARVGGYGCN